MLNTCTSNISCILYNQFSLDVVKAAQESCTHVGAVLFYVQYAVRLRDFKTCSEEKAYWLIPGYSEVEYKEIEDIDFSEPKTIKKTE